jgi:hypothetical protein
VEIECEDGGVVVFSETARAHILENHPELADHLDAIVATVAAPEHVNPDPRPGRERRYRRGVGPSRWMVVVVDSNREVPQVVTAMANRKDPRG